MRRRSMLVLTTVASVAGCATVAPSQTQRVDELAATERAFAANAARVGSKAAFLAVLDAQATLFRPGPVDGRTAIEAGPASGLQLAWQRQRIAVAASDDLGYSSGPYRLTLDARPGESTYGQFFSVWRRAPDGRWRLLIDQGTSHIGPGGWTLPVEAIASDGTTSGVSVETAEASFAATSMADGVAAAYRSNGSSCLRLLRDDLLPVNGLDRLASLPGGKYRWTWTVTDSGTSRAGDLAWAMGRYLGPDASAGYFVRLWHTERGDWKIVGDVLASIDEPRVAH